MKKNLILTLVAVTAIAFSGMVQAATKAQPVKKCANGKCGRR